MKAAVLHEVKKPLVVEEVGSDVTYFKKGDHSGHLPVSVLQHL